MNKKYEFTGETNDEGLKRIRALRDFGDVKAGDLGGWIEKEKNLSQEGNCWVSDNAEVYGEAVVAGNAEVFGDACVLGNAGVSGDAEVYGEAVVTGKAVVTGNAALSSSRDYITVGPVGSGRHITACRTEEGLVVCAGCFVGDDSAFEGAVLKKYGEDDPIGREYLMLLAVFRERFKEVQRCECELAPEAAKKAGELKMDDKWCCYCRAWTDHAPALPPQRSGGRQQQIVGKCRRTIVWHGEVQEIEVETHSFAWSGRIPCTGMRRCIYCGQYEHDLANDQAQV